MPHLNLTQPNSPYPVTFTDRTCLEYWLSTFRAWGPKKQPFGSCLASPTKTSISAQRRGSIQVYLKERFYLKATISLPRKDRKESHHGGVVIAAKESIDVCEINLHTALNSQRHHLNALESNRCYRPQSSDDLYMRAMSPKKASFHRLRELHHMDCKRCKSSEHRLEQERNNWIKLQITYQPAITR